MLAYLRTANVAGILVYHEALTKTPPELKNEPLQLKREDEPP